MTTAVLIDGAFFIRCYSAIHPTGHHRYTAKEIAAAISDCANKHAGNSLYRIFYYDCPPLLKKAHFPISKGVVDFSQSQVANFRLALFEELKRQRRVALRLGHLQDGKGWNIRSNCTAELLKGTKTWSSVNDQDFAYDTRQKGVDMRIGLDIASLSYKRLVKRIVLVAGDSDFVPAAKLARREGIEFFLDPMWQPINDTLLEHIDGIENSLPNPFGQSVGNPPKQTK